MAPASDNADLLSRSEGRPELPTSGVGRPREPRVLLGGGGVVAGGRQRHDVAGSSAGEPVSASR